MDIIVCCTITGIKGAVICRTIVYLHCIMKYSYQMIRSSNQTNFAYV